MNSTNLQNQSSFRKYFKSASTLVPVLLRRPGSEGIGFRPLCAICGEVIIDLEAANVITIDDPDAPSEPLNSLGNVDGVEVLELPGVAVAVHFECDRSEFKPWTRASRVFRLDQRSLGPVGGLSRGGTMSAPSAKKDRLRCPDCQIRDEFPTISRQTICPSFATSAASTGNHELVHDARCAVCVAKLWRTRLRALLMLLRSAPAARTDAL